MLGWMKHKLESRLPREISITSDMQMTPPIQKNEDHGIWSHHFMANRWGNNGNSDRLFLGGAPKSLQMMTAAMKLKHTYSLEGKL